MTRSSPAPEELGERSEADRSSAPVAFVFLLLRDCLAARRVVAGLTASIKLHAPDWLTHYEWLSFWPRAHAAPECARLRLGADGGPRASRSGCCRAC
jgi:hypothetical protein